MITRASRKVIVFPAVARSGWRCPPTLATPPRRDTDSYEVPSLLGVWDRGLLLVTIRASQVEVCWNSTSNFTYQVQYSSDLTTNLWTLLVNCVRSTGSKSCLSDPMVAGQPRRLYRVVQTNCVPSL